MDTVITVKTEKRSGKGKQDAKRLRKNGKVPGVLYGGDNEAVNLAIDLEDIRLIIKSDHGENSILNLQYEKTTTDAMVKEIQLDYLSERIMHVDLIRIDLKKTIIVPVPVVLYGEPIGVKLEDGILEFLTREIEIRSLPGQIPTEINVDISGLHAGQFIKVENLVLADGVQPVTLPQTVICTVISKAKEEEKITEESEAVVEEEKQPADKEA